MRILISTGHPAQIHNFRILRSLLIQNGHEVYWLATEKDISKYLLSIYQIPYIPLRKPGKSILSKGMVFLLNTIYSLKILREKKTDLIISRVSPYLSVAGFLLRKPHIGLSDTESAGIYDTIFTKMISVLITAKSYKRTLIKNHIRLDGNIELFYLHPRRFNPLEDVSGLLGIEKDQPYVILRFVSWDAYHDKGLSGFTDDNKISAVEQFSKYALVFISAEGELPAALEPYKIRIPYERMHDILANACLFFGESATMASESAVLGVPAIYLDEKGRGYTDEEEIFGLVYNFRNSLLEQEKAILKGVELLKTKDLKIKSINNSLTFLKDKIDVTGFMLWFIENYPESSKIMRENPDYQYRFK